MHISDFSLNRVTCEIRYDNAYSLWDKTGELWTEAAKIWPDIIPQAVDPNRQSFRVKDKISLQVDINKAFVIVYHSGIKEIIKEQEKFIKLVRNILDIKLFIRVGSRFFYEKKCDDQDHAADLILNTQKLKIPDGNFFNIEGKIKEPSFSFRIEDDNLGVSQTFKVAIKQYAFEKPIGLDELESQSLKNIILNYDVDYYTRLPVKPSQLNVAEWVSQVHHLIKRDSKMVLGDLK
ncbi:MAG: hypothetical protein WGN25_18520 [Candidatus Electrothrix sp. GW3-4]|uniref:hypothetical protein n=1 Tax=Candidatus Electrothrix sp. GW3-4 TaxID=3126740 RepID=UPI0030D0AD03